MWRVDWSVKASKLCNLRCRYCYEWDWLSDRQRIPLDGWRRILGAVRRYHDLQETRHGVGGESTVSWHGGEPSLLPRSYFREVLALGRGIFGAQALDRGEIRWGLVTNLFVLPRPFVDMLVSERFRVTVSYDLVSGARLDRRGRPSEERVAANLSRLLDRGVRPTAAVVLAGHTHRHLRRIYDFFAARQMPLKIIPALPVSQLDPAAPLTIDTPTAVAALSDLLEHWLDDGCRVEVEPLRSCLSTALLHHAGCSRPPRLRRRSGDRTWVVDTRGDVYPRASAYGPVQRLGNLFEQTLGELMAGGEYQRSLAEDERRVQEHCSVCTVRTACDNTPILTASQPAPGAACPIEAALCGAILQLLVKADTERAASSVPSRPQQPASGWSPSEAPAG